MSSEAKQILPSSDQRRVSIETTKTVTQSEAVATFPQPLRHWRRSPQRWTTRRNPDALCKEAWQAPHYMGGQPYCELGFVKLPGDCWRFAPTVSWNFTGDVYYCGLSKV